MEELHLNSIIHSCEFGGCPTFWQQLNYYLSYLIGNEKIERQNKEILEKRHLYKFYNLNKTELGELVNWDIKNSELENIKLIERTGYVPRIKMQARIFHLYFTHLNQGYWINFAISKNLNETELAESIKEFEQKENWKIDFDYKKDKIDGIFANEINLKFGKR